MVFQASTLLYIQSANGRTSLFDLPTLPVYERSQYGLLFALAFSLILMVFRTRMIDEPSFLMGLPVTRKQTENSYQPYHQGYQPPEKPSHEEYGTSQTSYYKQYEEYEKRTRIRPDNRCLSLKANM